MRGLLQFRPQHVSAVDVALCVLHLRLLGVQLVLQCDHSHLQANYLLILGIHQSLELALTVGKPELLLLGCAFRLDQLLRKVHGLRLESALEVLHLLLEHLELLAILKLQVLDLDHAGCVVAVVLVGAAL